jgi:hypothetical protein
MNRKKKVVFSAMNLAGNCYPSVCNVENFSCICSFENYSDEQTLASIRFNRPGSMTKK